MRYNNKNIFYTIIKCTLLEPIKTQRYPTLVTGQERKFPTLKKT